MAWRCTEETIRRSNEAELKRKRQTGRKPNWSARFILYFNVATAWVILASYCMEAQNSVWSHSYSILAPFIPYFIINFCLWPLHCFLHRKVSSSSGSSTTSSFSSSASLSHDGSSSSRLWPRPPQLVLPTGQFLSTRTPWTLCLFFFPLKWFRSRTQPPGLKI